MPQLIDKGFIRSNRPWDNYSTRNDGHGSSSGSSLRYRGWVLVDLLNGRYARRGLDKVRVCDLHVPQADALKAFHSIIDGIEGEQ